MNEEEKKEQEEIYDSDYWYEHLALEKELFEEPKDDIALPY